MELGEAIRTRKSIRAFLPDPIPRETLTKIVELARWAPSWANTQPWEVVVADGEKAQELGRLFVQEASGGASPRADLEIPVQWPDVHKNRYVGLGRDLLSFLGIQRDDKEGRNQHYMNMYKFFGAPACVYLIMDAGLSAPYACLDMGSFGTTLCLAAHAEGLGTIFLAASMHFPDIVRRVLAIPDTKKVVIGIAIGRPHPDAPASLFRSTRVPVEEILRFA
jgi:nitroreductase